jgi:beta-N-acetylhexosaminidase
VQTTLELSELEEKIGQIFMIGMPGPDLDSVTEKLIGDHGVGGVILFSRNIETPPQLAGLCRDLQALALRTRSIPLFLSIDQEGGRVARLKSPFTLFPGNEAIGRDPMALERAHEFATVTAREMSLVGLNMDLAPVMDVRRGEAEKHLTGRTFGDDPQWVAKLGSRVIETLQGAGVMAVAKHFPGLGRTERDPHHELPVIPIDAGEIETVNLPPFVAAMEAGVSAVMTSHAIYPALDGENPATLSRGILTGLLKERLGFGGMIITDDLEMGAIEKHWGVAEGAAASLAAGADVLLICKDQDNVLESLERVKTMLLQEEIPVERLLDAARRVGEAKASFLKAPPHIPLKAVEAYFRDKERQREEPNRYIPLP